MEKVAQYKRIVYNITPGAEIKLKLGADVIDSDNPEYLALEEALRYYPHRTFEVSAEGEYVKVYRKPPKQFRQPTRQSELFKQLYDMKLGSHLDFPNTDASEKNSAYRKITHTVRSVRNGGDRDYHVQSVGFPKDTVRVWRVF